MTTEENDSNELAEFRARARIADALFRVALALRRAGLLAEGESLRVEDSEQWVSAHVGHLTTPSSLQNLASQVEVLRARAEIRIGAAGRPISLCHLVTEYDAICPL